jgi:type IV pilus assembly protein PilY1
LLDSPMTGTPVVYPSDVGTVASKIFVGDSDGTIWRFDVSNPDSTQWFGDLYLDLYNQTADPTVATSWKDGQPFDVPMVASLDPLANVVLNVATGTTQSFDTTGVQALYSITEKLDLAHLPKKLRASVNWYWGPNTPPSASSPSSLLAGERVSGPMTVFDSVLYFSTFYAGTSTTACNPGQAKIWAFDYITAQDSSNPAKGGKRMQSKFPAASVGTNLDWADPTQAPWGAAPGAVVPGVTIMATPACATQSATGAGYLSRSVLSSFNAGTFSLIAPVGSKGSATAAGQASATLPPPTNPTVIDSWASVIE